MKHVPERMPASMKPSTGSERFIPARSAGCHLPLPEVTVPTSVETSFESRRRGAEFRKGRAMTARLAKIAR